MRVLVVGGTGLISSAIVRELLDRGDEVTLLNRGRTAAPPDGVRHLGVDRTDPAALSEAVAGAGPFDAAIDMVGYEPADAEGAVAALRGRVGRYVFCSTVDVYTKPAPRYPIREDAERRPSPAFPYALKKAQCEEIVWAAHDRGDLAVTVLRPAFAYGEGRGLVHTFGGGTAHLDRLRKGKPIVVHGDGTSLWCAGHRDDVARAFVAAVINPASAGRAYHVTGDELFTWNEYHAVAAAALGGPPPTLVHVPTDLLARADPERAWICAENFRFNNVFDLAAARADLGYSPSIPFGDGARRIVAWLDANGGLEDSDADPRDDRLIAAWHRLGAGFVHALRSTVA